MIAELAVRAISGAQQFLADGSSPSDIDPTTGKGPEWGEAAPIGLLVIVMMCVACYFLARSMSRNIKKVPLSFDDPNGSIGSGSANVDGSAAAGSAAVGRKIAGPGGPGSKVQPS